jgi:hypothetical protein
MLKFKRRDRYITYLGGGNQEKKLIPTLGYRVGRGIKHLKNKAIFLPLSAFCWNFFKHMSIFLFKITTLRVVVS